MTSVSTSLICKASIRIGAAALALAALGGCGLVPAKETLSMYAPEVHVQADPAWPTVRWQLQVPRPHASELLDSARIVVRPADGELQVYHGAVWAEPVPDLVQDAIVHAFEDSGRIAGVARRGSGIGGDYELLLDLRHFDSDYNGGGTPHAQVQLVAKLLSASNNTIVATRAFEADTVAGGTSVGEVARAFEASLTQVVQALVGWTLVQGTEYERRTPPLATPAAKPGRR